MNILYVSHNYPPEVCAPAVRVSELSRHWVSASHQVAVLTGFPNHPTGKIHPDYKRRFRRLVYCEEDQGVKVMRTWLVPLPNRKAWERILNYISFWLSSSLRGTFLPSPDIVIATSPQLFTGLTGYWLSRVKAAPFVFEVRDLWPESITASGLGRDDSAAIKTLARLTAFLYRKADHIVVVTPAFKSEIVDNWAIPPEKISVLENGVETEFFKPNGSVQNRNKECIVSYIGTLGLAHGLDTTVDAARGLAKREPKIQFRLIGEGADRRRIQKSIDEDGLENVELVPLQPRDKIPEFIRNTGICLVNLRKTPVFKTVIPTKMLESMSCAKPVLLGVDGQARQILENANAGLFFEPGNADDLVEKLLILYHDPERRKILGKNGRKAILRDFSRGKKAEEYIDILSRILEHYRTARPV